DVTRIGLTMRKRWRQQEHDVGVAVQQQALRLTKRARCSRRIAAAGYRRPRLRYRIDAAFGRFMRTHWGSVVEVGSAIPSAVPAVGFDRLHDACGLYIPTVGSFRFAPFFGNGGEVA